MKLFSNKRTPKTETPKCGKCPLPDNKKPRPERETMQDRLDQDSNQRQEGKNRRRDTWIQAAEFWEK